MNHSPGDIVFQEGLNPLGRLVEVRPALVVEDTAECLKLYFPAGAHYLSCDPAGMHGRQRYDNTLADRLALFQSREPMEMTERTNPRHVLSILPAGAMHAVWFFWSPGWELTHIFVNLQAPYERAGRAIRVVDYYLDLAVTPGLEWRWKDEDEFAGMCEAGAISPDIALAIRAEGERMTREIERRAWPFDGSIASWRPDPGWTVPAIITGAYPALSRQPRSDV